MRHPFNRAVTPLIRPSMLRMRREFGSKGLRTERHEFRRGNSGAELRRFRLQELRVDESGIRRRGPPHQRMRKRNRGGIVLHDGLGRRLGHGLQLFNRPLQWGQ